MACRSGQVVGDLLSGKKLVVDLAGLTIERYGQAA
jgi:hypothetical protein